MKICIMGNSHVGALKLGWDIIRSQYKDIKIDFVSRGQGLGALNTLQVKGAFITNPTSDPNAKNINWPTVDNQISIDEYDCFVFVAMGVPKQGLRQIYSSSFIRSWKNDLEHSSPVFSLAFSLARFNKHIFLVRSPFPSRAKSSKTYDEYCLENNYFNEAFKAEGIRRIPQSPKTIARGMAETDGSYSKGDGTHMNADYGKIEVRNILRHLMAGV